ncbi:MAG: hypothetical protein V4772_08550 [Pseudomonadota bacterium]
MFKVTSLTIKLFGKKETVFRVFKNGELVRVCESQADADSWVAAQ